MHFWVSNPNNRVLRASVKRPPSKFTSVWTTEKRYTGTVFLDSVAQLRPIRGLTDSIDLVTGSLTVHLFSALRVVSARGDSTLRKHTRHLIN